MRKTIYWIIALTVTSLTGHLLIHLNDWLRLVIELCVGFCFGYFHEQISSFVRLSND